MADEPRSEIDCINSGGTWSDQGCVYGTPPDGATTPPPTGGLQCPDGYEPGSGVYSNACVAKGTPAGTSGQAGNSSGSGNSGGYNFSGMPDWQPFKYDFNFGDAPGFTARRFSAPNPEDILNDPSYKWRLGQSLQAFENSAAARGVARTGNTAKGLIDYAGNSASQEYGNAFDRSLKIFQTDYQGDLDEYKPKLISYQTNAAGKQRAQELQSADLWRQYLANMDWTRFLLSEAA